MKCPKWSRFEKNKGPQFLEVWCVFPRSFQTSWLSHRGHPSWGWSSPDCPLIGGSCHRRCRRRPFRRWKGFENWAPVILRTIGAKCEHAYLLVSSGCSNISHFDVVTATRWQTAQIKGWKVHLSEISKNIAPLSPWDANSDSSTASHFDGATLKVASFDWSTIKQRSGHNKHHKNTQVWLFAFYHILHNSQGIPSMSSSMGLMGTPSRSSRRAPSIGAPSIIGPASIGTPSTSSNGMPSTYSPIGAPSMSSAGSGWTKGCRFQWR